MTNLDFFALDQEYLPRELVREETLKTLATLELKKHRLRMELVANNGNGEAKLNNGATIAQELALVDNQLVALKTKFSDVLHPPQEPVSVDAGQ